MKLLKLHRPDGKAMYVNTDHIIFIEEFEDMDFESKIRVTRSRLTTTGGLIVAKEDVSTIELGATK